MNGDLDALLEDLAATLGAACPLFVESLRPGLRTHAVAKALEGAGLTPDPAVVAWFGWRDGASLPGDPERDMVELLPAWRPLPLDEALTWRTQYLAMLRQNVDADLVDELWPGHWLPLLTDGVTDIDVRALIVFPTGRSRAGLLEVSLETPDPWPAYDGIEGMVHTVAEGWRAGVFGLDPDNRLQTIDRARHAEVFERYNPATVQDWITRSGGDRTVASVVAALGSAGWEARGNAALLLQALHATDEVPGLIAMLEDEDPHLRRFVVGILRQIGAAQASRAVARLAAEDPDPDVRQEALLALGSADDEPSTATLQGALGDPDPETVYAAASSLARLQHPAALAPCLAMLKDRSAAWRWTAAALLGDLGDSGAVDALVEALADPVDQVRWNAASALGKIRDRRAAKALRRALEDGDATVRAIARGALDDLSTDHKER